MDTSSQADDSEFQEGRTSTSLISPISRQFVPKMCLSENTDRSYTTRLDSPSAASIGAICACSRLPRPGHSHQRNRSGYDFGEKGIKGGFRSRIQTGGGECRCKKQYMQWQMTGRFVYPWPQTLCTPLPAHKNISDLRKAYDWKVYAHLLGSL